MQVCDLIATMNEAPKPSPPKERLMVYVDGFNLYHGLHDTSVRQHLWLDLAKLAQSLRPKQQLVGVRYFTATILNDPTAQSRQGHYIEALSSKNPGIVEVILGRYQAKTKACRGCGHSYTSYEEKETDVNMATSIVVDAANGAFDSALIISGDSDMAPAVRAAKKSRQDLFIAAAFPPGRFSQELKHLMPASFPINVNKVNKALLPDVFVARGKTFTRPQKWR